MLISLEGDMKSKPLMAVSKITANVPQFGHPGNITLKAACKMLTAVAL